MFRRYSAVRFIRAGRPPISTSTSTSSTSAKTTSNSSSTSGSTPSDSKSATNIQSSEPGNTNDKQKTDFDKATDNLLQNRKFLLGIAAYTGYNWPIHLGLWYVKRLQNKRATGEAVMAQPKRWLKTFGYFLIICSVIYGFWWLIFEYDVDKHAKNEKKKK